MRQRTWISAALFILSTFLADRESLRAALVSSLSAEVANVDFSNASDSVNHAYFPEQLKSFGLGTV